MSSSPPPQKRPQKPHRPQRPLPKRTPKPATVPKLSRTAPTKRDPSAQDQLNLSGEPLPFTPDLAPYTNLHKLLIKEAHLADVSWIAKAGEKLTFLDVSGNADVKSWKGLEKLTGLLVFKATHCNLQAVPKQLAGLTKLKALVLSDNALPTFSSALCALPDLNTLVLSHNPLTHLPPLTLPSLTKLSLSYTLLTGPTLPDLSGLPHIREVRLASNGRLAALPPHVRAWGKAAEGAEGGLEIVDLSSCMLAGWESVAPLLAAAEKGIAPGRMPPHPNLVNLSLKGNPLASEPSYKDHILAHLPSIRILDGMRFDARFLSIREKRAAHPLGAGLSESAARREKKGKRKRAAAEEEAASGSGSDEQQDEEEGKKRAQKRAGRPPAEDGERARKRAGPLPAEDEDADAKRAKKRAGLPAPSGGDDERKNIARRAGAPPTSISSPPPATPSTSAASAPAPAKGKGKGGKGPKQELKAEPEPAEEGKGGRRRKRTRKSAKKADESAPAPAPAADAPTSSTKKPKNSKTSTAPSLAAPSPSPAAAPKPNRKPAAPVRWDADFPLLSAPSPGPTRTPAPAPEPTPAQSQSKGKTSVVKVVNVARPKAREGGKSALESLLGGDGGAPGGGAGLGGAGAWDVGAWD